MSISHLGRIGIGLLLVLAAGLAFVLKKSTKPSSPTELSRPQAAEAVPIHTVPVGEHVRILHATGCVVTLTDWYTFAHAAAEANQKAIKLLVVQGKVLVLHQGDRATKSSPEGNDHVRIVMLREEHLGRECYVLAKRVAPE